MKRKKRRTCGAKSEDIIYRNEGQWWCIFVENQSEKENGDDLYTELGKGSLSRQPYSATDSDTRWRIQRGEDGGGYYRGHDLHFSRSITFF